MFRAVLIAMPLLLAPVAAPAPLLDASAAAQSRTGEQCQRRNQGRRRGGAIAGVIGRNVLGRFGGGGVASVVLAPMGSMLGDAIMTLLDCEEQEQAAAATEQAVDRAERRGVGTSANWRSETRDNVRGSSTVTAVEARAPDGECMVVTDVVIIDGQETSAPKRMCRRPPNNRYVRV